MDNEASGIGRISFEMSPSSTGHLVLIRTSTNLRGRRESYRPR